MVTFFFTFYYLFVVVCVCIWPRACYNRQDREEWKSGQPVGVGSFDHLVVGRLGTGIFTY